MKTDNTSRNRKKGSDVTRNKFALFILLTVTTGLLAGVLMGRASPKDTQGTGGGNALLGARDTAVASTETARTRTVLDAVTRATPRYIPVIFSSHEFHVRVLDSRCGTCHHDGKDADDAPRPCSQCHNRTDADTDLAGAMHERCRGCHLRERGQRSAGNAPIECLECHRERTR